MPQFPPARLCTCFEFKAAKTPRTCDGNEGRAAFTGNCASQQRLAAAGRPKQQHAARRLPAHATSTRQSALTGWAGRRCAPALIKRFMLCAPSLPRDQKQCACSVPAILRSLLPPHLTPVNKSGLNVGSTVTSCTTETAKSRVHGPSNLVHALRIRRLLHHAANCRHCNGCALACSNILTSCSPAILSHVTASAAQAMATHRQIDHYVPDYQVTMHSAAKQACPGHIVRLDSTQQWTNNLQRAPV